MSDRLPKNLRRRVAVEASYSFCGFPLSGEQVAQWPPRLLIRDERDGTYVTRISRCTCGRPVLPGSLDGISCSEHDDELTAAMHRHPAGRGLDPDKPFPSRFSERYDPSPEPIDRKIQ